MAQLPPTLFAILLALAVASSTSVAAPAIQSVDTGYTITKVRTAEFSGRTVVVGSSYEGTLLAYDETGKRLWKNRLSGYMNHDLWCEDITQDGNDEILAANADGSVYCLNHEGKQLWKFKPSEAPMYAVCAVRHKRKTLVVCGGFDTNIYYVSATGARVKVLPSSAYSIAKPRGKNNGKPLPPNGLHVANFLRKLVHPDGTETLVLHGMMNTMQGKSALYLFEPMADIPSKVFPVDLAKGTGELRTTDDGAEILLGNSTHGKDSEFVRLDLTNGQTRHLKAQPLGRELDRFGYRVVQPVELPPGSAYKYMLLYGARIVLVPADMSATSSEVLACKYSFHDVWRDKNNSKVILASSQSGGSCIHWMDLYNADWKQAYRELNPPGKIASILKASQLVREKSSQFKRPAWERAPLPVYLMSEKVTESVKSQVESLKSNYKSPVFLGHKGFREAEKWDRSKLDNETYRKKRDRRRKYTLTQQQAIDGFTAIYQDELGAAYWAGHGNDPYMFTLETLKKVINQVDGKKTVLIYPELEDHSDDFEFVLKDHFYPLAAHAQGRNTNIYVRTKHCFWQGNAYLPMWSRLLSGEFADVFVPSMEETTDKSMELSVAGRLGIWASGATNSWGSRCARDNTSFDRMRQHSHQMLPNHFLRMMIYHVSSGAQYLDNFAVDQEYMSLLWELIAKGALYVPKREEIVSFSPVHLSMLEPDHDYMLESSNVKWCTFFDAKREAARPMVFSRLNGSWPGAPNTPWDFSRYAAGAKERRLNFLPSYSNGLVLITPPQAGAHADQEAPRGALRDRLHPLYRDILKEYYSDGKHYYSANSAQKLPADEYYKVIEKDIIKSAQRLPLTVTGDVAWVAAQTSPTHVRLTLIDSGYINPKTRTATVSFQAAKPKKVVDVLFGNEFDISDPAAVQVKIPCGMFRFLDVELESPLVATPSAP